MSVGVRHHSQSNAASKSLEHVDSSSMLPADVDDDAIDVELTGFETIEQLEQMYAQVCQQQNAIERRLQTFTSDDLRCETDLLRLLAELGGLHVLETDAKELDAALDFSANLGDKVTRQIKSLDAVRSRVASTLQRVEDIIDLKLCTDGVQQALQNEEFEQAAAHIHRFLKLDAEVLRMSVAAASVSEDDAPGSPQPPHSPEPTGDGTEQPPTSPPATHHHPTGSLEASLKLLKESEMKLKSIVRRQFDDAVRKNDVASVERFFKIFPLLKLNKEGLEKFSRYLANQMADSCRNLVRRHVDVDEMAPRYNVRFADAASMLLEEAARVLDVHRPLVETYYGPGQMLDFVKVLQKECDISFKQLLQEFRQKRRFAAIYGQVEALAKLSSKKSFANLERPDTKQLDVILAEMSLINVKVEQYVSFVKRRLETDLEACHNEAAALEQAKKDANRWVMSTQLVHGTQELLGQYVSLEEYLMREMVLKAIGIDAIEEGSPCSTVVDDVFFVVKKSLHRAICSSSVDIVCAMVNHTAILLDDQYVTVLKTRLRSAASAASAVAGQAFDLAAQAYSFMQSKASSANLAGSAAAAMSSSAPGQSGDGSSSSGGDGVLDSRQLLAWCVALNNVDVSADYVDLLKTNVVDEIKKLFSSLSEQSQGKLEMVLSTLTAVRDKLREIQASGAQQFTQAVIRPKLKPAIEVFSSTELNITEEEYAAYESEDPWCQALIRQIDRLLSAVKVQLTSNNHEQIIKGVVGETAQLLERSLMKMRFSKLGGMQLDKDIRKLVTYLTSITSWSIRDRFARLTQISTLLSLEREQELVEYLQSDSSFAWRLTPTEIRQVLSLRVDFSSENIKKLKLG